MSLKTNDDRIVGVLHDVVEDTALTLETLRQEGFSEEILAAVDSVTNRESEDYPSFVLRAAQNPIDKRVKLADLKDNSDVTRLAEITERDLARLEKYRQAIETLNA